MDEAVATFVTTVQHGYQPYQLLQRTSKYERRKHASKLLSACLGEACTVTQGPYGRLEVGFVNTVEDNELSAEAVDVLRWMRATHASIRSTRRLRRHHRLRWEDVVATRRLLTPYRGWGVVLECGGVRRTGAVCDLKQVVDTMVQCAKREDSMRLSCSEDGCVLVVVAFDATPFHQASATRCDVYVDVWRDEGASALPRCWGTWWVCVGVMEQMTPPISSVWTG